LQKIFSCNKIQLLKISLRKKRHLHTIGLRMAAHPITQIGQLVSKRWAQRPWLHRSWWVIAFAILCAGLYFHAMQGKEASYQEMSARLKTLEREKALAIVQYQDLALQIKSQSDPAWVEMVLKRNLGVVPEGQTKVYFTEE
jgi:hypothetical protein